MHFALPVVKAVGTIRQVSSLVQLISRNMSTRNINFNTKHLRKGDPLPPYNGKLRLYNMRYCPFAQRTVLALNAKQIDYEVVNINLYEKPEWLNSKSPFGKVPSLEIKEGVTIYESLITVEYLDEVYPQRPLLSKDPVQKANDRIIAEAVGPVQSFFGKLIRNPTSVDDDAIATYHKALDYIQGQLKSRGTKFFGGNEPGFADYMIWPWFERLLPYAKIDKRANIDASKFDLLVKYLELMKKDPVVTEYLIPDDIMFKFLEPYKNATEPNYDLLLQE